MTRRSKLLLSAFAVVATATAALPTDAAAQRRAVRRPAMRSVVVVGARPYYRPVPFAPFFGYYGWYPSWYGWYGDPYLYAYPMHVRQYHYRNYLGSARIQVEPRNAEVFVDGYFAGLVDDFDGWAQRLSVEPGEHVLEIYLAGHRTYRQPVLFRPGATIRIQHVMQPLRPGESPEARPLPASGSRLPREADAARPPREARPARPRGGSPAVTDAESGTVAFRVQPVDAEVVVNGESWSSPEAGSLTLQLPDGTHAVEVRKEGYRTYTAEIRVKRGETTSLNVSLSRN